MTPDPIILTAGLNQNCQLFRGEDKLINVTMTGYDPATATSLQWWLAKSAWSEDPDILIKKSLTEGIVASPEGIAITVDAIDTVAIPPDLYYHELKIVQADGTIKVAMAGNVVVRMALDMEL
jgi:hypothetical protein